MGQAQELPGSLRAAAAPGLALLRLALLLYAAPRCAAVSIKSVQVWSQQSTVGGVQTWAEPQPYANILKSSAAGSTNVNQVSARAPISQWTAIGCYAASGTLEVTQTGLDPLTCSLLCEERNFNISAMRGTACSCLANRSSIIAATAAASCDQPCLATYFNATTRLCGGSTGTSFYSYYQKYDYIHQAAQGCYDPWRFIWYQSVAVETITPAGPNPGDQPTVTVQWFLHAASINSGDPQFPYHYNLSNLLLGLQYDLDNSRLVGYSVPYWATKNQADDWLLNIEIYRVNSLRQDNIFFTQTLVPFRYADSSAQSIIFNSGATALDAIYNVYYLTLPMVPQVAGLGFIMTSFQTKLYGINLNITETPRIILQQDVTHEIALMDVNSKYHDLMALLLESVPDPTQPRSFYYVRLGQSVRNNLTQLVEFQYTFQTPTRSVVNPLSFAGFLDKYYQVGSTTVDHLTNTSFVVYKDLPNNDAPYYVKDLNHRGALSAYNYDPMAGPDVQATWLVNTDPIIPLTLPAPQLVSARFTIDGRSIMVQFDTFTIMGALPIDADGDFIPDGEPDWSVQHIGQRNCSDIFARQTATLLGNMPATSCEWRSGTQIEIHVSIDFNALGVGDGLFLKDSTVYAYLRGSNEWSMAASGGVSIGLPEPLDPPALDVTYAGSVDLCSAVTLNGEKSHSHGGRPVWTWELTTVSCVNVVETDFITQRIRDELARSSKFGDTLNGVNTVTFLRDDLEPGCTYTIKVTLEGRWGLSSTSDLVITKKPLPAPQVTILGPSHVFNMRSREMIFMTDVQKSQCDSLLAESRALRFEWRAVEARISDFNNAIVEVPLNLGLLDVRNTGSSIIIPALTLTPTSTYTFTVKVGYTATWEDPNAYTEEQVKLTVTRTPIKVNIVGGSRKASKAEPIVIDARSSIDPDYPNQPIEISPDWSFTYNCTTETGDTGCYPTLGLVTALPDVTQCNLGDATFRDLGTLFQYPVFGTGLQTSDSYYCKDPVRNGLLTLNLPNEFALTPQNYTFIVQATAHGRFSSAAMVLTVEPGDIPPPKVVIDPITDPRVSTTRVLRVTGNLIPEDRTQYSDIVTWSWEFFRQEDNPRWTASAAAAAAAAGQAYLVPEFIYNPAAELSTPSAFRSNLRTNNIVVKPNILRPSATYAFRLKATAPHPQNGPDLVGYADVIVNSAGPAPTAGQLVIEPAGESEVNVQKTLRAQFFSAEDTPLTYMFTYRTGLSTAESTTMNLRVAPINEPSQLVDCFRAGEAADNFMVEVNVTATTIYGASTTVSVMYRSLPPTNVNLANALILISASEAAPEAQKLLLNCITLGSTPVQSSGGLPPVTTTAAPAEQQANQDTAQQMIQIMDQATDVTTPTASSVSTNLEVVKQLATNGVVSDNMLDFIAKLAASIADLADAGAADDQVIDDMATAVFGALGAMGKTRAVSSADAVNANNPDTGAVFPSARRLSWDEVKDMPRRLQSTSNESFVVQLGFLPPWDTLPIQFQDTRWTTNRAPASQAQEQQQEDLEAEWVAFINGTEANAAFVIAQRAVDDEYFANYSAHLSAAERETVAREWWEERARIDSAQASLIYDNSQLTARLVEQMGLVAQTVVKFMVTGEDTKDYPFPMGVVHIGKARDLSNAYPSFSFQDSKWKLTGNATGAYGYSNIEFTQVNPLSWATSSPKGPFVVSSLEVFRDDGSKIDVLREPEPIKVMANHQSFASASCFYWDWQAENGLGDWSQSGVLNGANGCVASHLSIFGQFLDPITPDLGIVLPTAVTIDFDTNINRYNVTVICCICAALVLAGLFHFWAHKQDDADRKKPMEMKKLGDGVTKPRSQDDPVDYTSYGVKQWVLTCWHIVQRDHIVVSCFFRDHKMKTTRLQKVSVLFAAVAGVSAVAALFFAEEVVDKKHFVEIGIVAGVIVHPMVRLLFMMFTMRPFRDGGPLLEQFAGIKPQASEYAGPLEALPVPDDEQDEEEDDDAAGGAGPRLALPPVAPAGPGAPPPPTATTGKAALPAIKAAGPPPAGSMGPEEGGGPQFTQVLPGPPPRQGGFEASQAPPPPPPRRQAAAEGSGAAPGPPPKAIPTRRVVPEPEHSMMPSDEQGQQPGDADLEQEIRRALGEPGPPSGELQVSPTGAGPPAGGLQHGLTDMLDGLQGEQQEQLPQTYPSADGGAGGAAMASPGAASSAAGAEALASVGLGTFLASAPAAQELPEAPLPPLPPPAEDPEQDGAQQMGPGLPVSTGLAAVAGGHLPAVQGGAALPRPPLAGPASGRDEQALALISQPAPSLSPQMPAPEGAGGELAQSQAQLLRRVRRMYIEKVVKHSERLAYDERVDMRSSVSHPVAQTGTILAYTAVMCYWFVAVLVTAVFAVHLGGRDAARWFYSCLIGWGFIFIALELVKAILSTILELEHFNQRRRLRDNRSLRDQVKQKKDRKARQMFHHHGHHLGPHGYGGGGFPQVQQLQHQVADPAPAPPPALPAPPVAQEPGRGDASAG